jgi:hypothetical protein
MGQQFNRLDARMVVRMFRLLVKRSPAFIALNQPTLGEMFNPKVSLAWRCLVVGENRGCHLDRAVAQRVLHAKAAVAILLAMSLHRLCRNRLHHEDDVLMRWFHPSVVFVTNRLAGGGAIRVFPNQPTADDEANLFKECRQFVRGSGCAERDHVAAGFQHPKALPPDGGAGDSVVPVEIAKVDAVGWIGDDGRDAVGEDGFQHLCAVPALQDRSGARGVLDRQFGGGGREVGRGVHGRSFCVWTVQVGADSSPSSDFGPID